MNRAAAATIMRAARAEIHTRSGTRDPSVAPATIGWVTAEIAPPVATTMPICVLVSPLLSMKTLANMIARQNALQYADCRAAWRVVASRIRASPGGGARRQPSSGDEFVLKKRGARALSALEGRFFRVKQRERLHQAGLVGHDDRVLGGLAAAHGVALHELTPVRASLEEAFMELTRDSFEYRSEPAAEGSHNDRPTHHRHPRRGPARVVPGRPALGVD